MLIILFQPGNSALSNPQTKTFRSWVGWTTSSKTIDDFCALRFHPSLSVHTIVVHTWFFLRLREKERKKDYKKGLVVILLQIGHLLFSLNKVWMLINYLNKGMFYRRKMFETIFPNTFIEIIVKSPKTGGRKGLVWQENLKWQFSSNRGEAVIAVKIILSTLGTKGGKFCLPRCLRSLFHHYKLGWKKLIPFLFAWFHLR